MEEFKKYILPIPKIKSQRKEHLEPLVFIYIKLKKKEKEKW